MRQLVYSTFGDNNLVPNYLRSKVLVKKQMCTDIMKNALHRNSSPGLIGVLITVQFLK